MTLPAWVRKIVEHAATVLVTAAGMALVSCASNGDLGAIAGGLIGGGDDSVVAGSLTQDDLQTSLEGAGLQCENQQRLDDLLAERDTFKGRVLDCRAEAAELRTGIHRKVAAAVEVPEDVTTIGGLVDLLIADRARVMSERDAAIERLETIQAALQAPQEDTE